VYFGPCPWASTQLRPGGEKRLWSRGRAKRACGSGAPEEIREGQLKVAALARRRTGSDWQQLELEGAVEGVLESFGQS
jgi:hypothetical protein